LFINFDSKAFFLASFLFVYFFWIKFFIGFRKVYDSKQSRNQVDKNIGSMLLYNGLKMKSFLRSYESSQRLENRKPLAIGYTP
jgi:hypothetical protein